MGNGLSVGLNDDLHWREVRETEGGYHNRYFMFLGDEGDEGEMMMGFLHYMSLREDTAFKHV
jgi:hypothetical protein